MRALAVLSALLCLCLLSTKSSLAAQPDQGFSKYVLAAVEILARDRAGKGYGNSIFTQDLKFGDAGTLKASKPPITMCVAAQMEVLVEALNLYAKETGDFSPFRFLPRVVWTRLRPLDLRGMIWIVDIKTSKGAASAFERYGMGKLVSFKDMFPGGFLNFNRTNGSGHGAVFLGFIDRQGNDVAKFSADVAGFKYFSAQGMGKPDGGLGYRWGFFSDAGCPQIGSGKKRDCGIIRSEANGYLFGGYVSMPSNWDKAKANAAVISSNQASDPKLREEGVLNAKFFTGVTVDD